MQMSHPSLAGMDELFARFPIQVDVGSSVARWARRLIPIAAAAIYLALWMIAEAGRSPLLPKYIMFSLWAIALGLAGMFPRIALAATIAVPVVILAVGLMAEVVLGTYGLHVPWVAGWLSLSTTWPAWLAAPIVVGYIAMTFGRRRQQLFCLLVGVASALIYAMVLVLDGWLSWAAFVVGEGLSGLISGCLVLAFGLVFAVLVAWLIGVGLASMRRVQVVTDRLHTTTAKLDEADVELRLAHDRGRISRDVHDSLAHSLAIIVAQADGAAASRESKPDALPESLDTISSVARTALGEVRRLVERINDDDVDEHRSRLEHIQTLVDDVSAAGMDANLRVLGDIESIGLSKQVAVYRIVQESLTNALKHAGRNAAVTVTLDGQGAGLAVLVVSTCNGDQPLVSSGSRGIGIAGMKERARLVGGWLTAMPSDDETFVVTAFIPSDAEAHSGEAVEISQAPSSESDLGVSDGSGKLAIEASNG